MNTEKHTLITGGAGFIGSHLVDRLLSGGRSVVVIDDFSTGNLANVERHLGNPRFRLIREKVSECGNLSALAAAAEEIYHLAAVVGVDLVIKSCIKTIEVNLAETQAILSAAAAHGAPTLIASTSEVYGKSSKSVFSEEDDLLIGPPHLSRWSYACSKLLDEFLGVAHARERGLPVTIARLFNTVGPRQTGRFGMVLPRFIEAARKGLPLRVFGDGSQTRCFCYVADTIEALTALQSLPEKPGEVYNVGGTEPITILNLAQLVIKKLGSSSSVEFVPYERAYAPGFEDMARRRPAIGKLERAVGFRPRTSLEEIIHLTAQTEV